MSFSLDIRKFEEKALLAANTSVCKAFESLAIDAIVFTTEMASFGRYATGDIANNWHVSEGAVNLVVPNGPNKSGVASLSRVKAFAASPLFYRKDNVVFLTNVMNYAHRANAVGWPRGAGTNGWIWTNGIGPYNFVGRAINRLQGKYQ